MNKKHQKALAIISKYVKEETQIRKANGDKEIIEIIKKVNSRKEYRSGDVLTVRQFCDSLIKRRLEKLASALPDDGYSMGSLITLHCQMFQVSKDTRQEYAHSSKYKATHGGYRKLITPEELRHTYNIGGVFTYIYPNQKSKVKKCWWYEGRRRKQYFYLEKVEGYIYGGYHSTSKETAKKYGKENIDREKLAKNRDALIAKALRKQYSYQDSINAGNCEVGTKLFIRRCGLDINKKYRGSYLLKLAESKNKESVFYVKKMINFKIK